MRPPHKAGTPGAPPPKAVEPRGPPTSKAKTAPPAPVVAKQPMVASGTSRLAGIQAIVQGQSAGEFVFAAQIELVNYNHLWAISDLAASISAEISSAPQKLTQLANHPLYFLSQTVLAMDMASKNLAAQCMPDDVNFPGISAARTAYAVAQAPGFDQLAIYGPTAGAQTSMLIAGSTDYGPIVTCYGASDTQLLQQTGGVPAVPTLPCVGSGFWLFDL